MRKDVENWLKCWFRNRGKISGHNDLRIDIDYFDGGLLTSMEVVEFVTEIESQFAMQFSDQDLQDPRFVTIAGLAELIDERSSQLSSAQVKESR